MMKKVIAINGSPRRNGNTAELLHQALNGAQEAVRRCSLSNVRWLMNWARPCWLIKMESSLL